MFICKICHGRRSRFFCRKGDFNYFFCPICQNLFLHPQPTKKIISNYYKETFRYQAGFANQRTTILRAQIVIKKLKKLNPAGKTLLDIGSGLGLFGQEAEKNNLKTTGVEPSKFLRQSINQLIDTHPFTFESYFKKNKKKRFDFITLNHVIEHLPNPTKTINQIAQILNKNGILYIETPNLNSHLFLAEKENYTFLTPPEHLWVFSPKSISQIISHVPPLEIIKSSTYSYPEHLMGIIKKILNIKYQISNKINEKTYTKTSKKQSKFNWKYLLFDKLLAPLFMPLLNLKGYGSILELYIKKK